MGIVYYQTGDQPRDAYAAQLPPQSNQFQAYLNGDRIKGVVPYLASAIAGFIQRRINAGGDPWLYAPPGSIFSIKPALQATDYIHMVRDISMRPALSFESSAGSTPSPIARDQSPTPQMVSVFAQNNTQWQAGAPPYNYGFVNYQQWLQAQISAAPNVSGTSGATPGYGPNAAGG